MPKNRLMPLSLWRSNFYSDLGTVLVFVVVVIMFILLTFYLSSFSTAWLLRYRVSHLELSLATQVQGVPFGAKSGFSGTWYPIWSTSRLLRYRMSYLANSLAAQVQGVPFGALAAQVQGVPFGEQPGCSGTWCHIWSISRLFRYRVSHFEHSLASQVHGVPFEAPPGYSGTGCPVWSIA